MISLSVCLMAAGWSAERRENVERIVRAIGPEEISNHWQDFQIFYDFHRRGVWWNGKRCWQYGAQCNSTHHMILQDDIYVCKDFARGVLEVIKAVPNDPINLFQMPRKALDGSKRWGLCESGTGQAAIIPTRLISKFLDWEKENIKPSFKPYDSRLSLFFHRQKIRFKITMPHLVDHLDTQLRSVIGHKTPYPRVSTDFMGERSPLDFDWSDTGDYMKSINSYPPKYWEKHFK